MKIIIDIIEQTLRTQSKGVDIETRPHNWTAMEGRPLLSLVKMLGR